MSISFLIVVLIVVVITGVSSYLLGKRRAEDIFVAGYMHGFGDAANNAATATAQLLGKLGICADCAVEAMSQIQREMLAKTQADVKARREASELERLYKR